MYTVWLLLNPPEDLHGMANNVGFTFSVGDTTLRLTISIEQDKSELVPLNIIFRVVDLP